MNTRELISHAAHNSGATKAEVQRVLDGILDGIEQGLLEDGKVTLRGIGTLSVRQVKDRTVQNPNTREPMLVAGGGRVHFRPSKILREAVR